MILSCNPELYKRRKEKKCIDKMGATVLMDLALFRYVPDFIPFLGLLTNYIQIKEMDIEICASPKWLGMDGENKRF